jgi:hypothetical protein
VDFLAKYKPALEALLAHTNGSSAGSAADAATLVDEISPSGKQAVARKGTPRKATAAQRAATRTPPAKKGARRSTTSAAKKTASPTKA